MRGHGLERTDTAGVEYLRHLMRSSKTRVQLIKVAC